MGEFELVLDEQLFRVPILPLVNCCKTFQLNLKLLGQAYHVRSRVSSSSFRVFVQAINGSPVEVTKENVSDLELLCQEFAFTNLAAQVERFMTEHPIIDHDVQQEIDDLKEQNLNQQRLIGILQSDLRGCQFDYVKFEEEQKREIRELNEKITFLKHQISKFQRFFDEQQTKVSVTNETNTLREQQRLQVQEIQELQQTTEKLRKALSRLTHDNKKIQDAFKEQRDLQDREIRTLKMTIEGFHTLPSDQLDVVKSGMSSLDLIPQADDEGEISDLKREDAPRQEETISEENEISKVKHRSELSPNAPLGSSSSSGLPRKPNVPSEPQPRKPRHPRRASASSRPNSAILSEPFSDEKSEHQFLPKTADPLDGIIAYLTKKCGGNLHDKGIVVVTSSKPYSGDSRYAAKNVLDFQGQSSFWSAGRWNFEDIPHTRNNWICYDFKKRKVIPTAYAIRSYYDGGVNGLHPKSWIIEISMDGESWKQIDRQENNADLRGRGVTCVFKTSRADPCHLIRMVNVGRNHFGDEMLCISAFEIFGTLMD